MSQLSLHYFVYLKCWCLDISKRWCYAKCFFWKNW